MFVRGLVRGRGPLSHVVSYALIDRMCVEVEWPNAQETNGSRSQSPVSERRKTTLRGSCGMTCRNIAWYSGLLLLVDNDSKLMPFNRCQHLHSGPGRVRCGVAEQSRITLRDFDKAMVQCAPHVLSAQNRMRTDTYSIKQAIE